MGWIEDLNKGVNQGLADFWKQANRPMNFKAPDASQLKAVKNPSSGSTMSRPDRTWSENITGTGGSKPKAATADRTSSTTSAGTQYKSKQESDMAHYGGAPGRSVANQTVEKSQLEKFQDYLATIDPGDYDYKKAVTDAFAKAYAGLDKAANTARTNKDSSAKAVMGLAQGGSNLVKGEAKNYQKITDDTARTNNSIYSGQVAGLQADRDKELAARAEFLQKLGIQEAGLGSAGSTQTNAINEALGTQSRSADRINQYGQADQSLNNSRAQSILNEGTARQADLEGQLQKILGGIDNKRADIGAQEAQAMAQAEQQAYANQLAKFQAGVGAYDKQMENEFKMRDQAMQEAEFQAKYGGGAGGVMGKQSMTPTGNQAADQYVASQGEDPNAYRSFMTNFMQELANDPNVRTNQVNDYLVQGQMLKAALDAGLNPNIVANMFELQNKAPVKYMDQNKMILN